MEVQRGLAGRAPAELNLALQEKYKTDFVARSAAIDQDLADLQHAGLAPEQARLVHELQTASAGFRQEAEHIFTFAGSFAQEEAVKVLQGSFATADTHVKQVLDQLVQGTSAAAKAQVGRIGTSSRHTKEMLLAISVGLILLVAGVCLTLARGITRALSRVLVAVHRLAEGDLTQRLEVKSTDEVGALAHSFNACIDRFQQIITEVKQQATHVTRASEQLSTTAAQISSDAQQQASSLEETAASLEQITGTVQQNAANARQANQLAISSHDAAERGGQVVAAAVAAMGEIDGAAQKIADISSSIDTIAFQTSLLALNAAVEAARAGEHGRGFAVVAAEVRHLAQRSATAAKEIKQLVQDSVHKVGQGSALVYRSGQTLQEIIASVQQVADCVAAIAAASQEQAQGIAQVNQAVTQMDGVVQHAAAQTDTLSSTAQGLSLQAQQLQGLVECFTLAQDAPGLEPSLEEDHTVHPMAFEHLVATAA